MLLQLCHKAHAAQIDAQHRNLVGVGVPGGVEDGAIPTKAHQHVGVLQLGAHLPKGLVGGQVDPAGVLQIKGQADDHLGPVVLQNPLGGHGCFKPPVPVRVGAE